MDGPGKASTIDSLGLHTRIDCTMQGDDCEDRLQDRLQDRLHIAHRMSRCVQFAHKELQAGTVWKNEAHMALPACGWINLCYHIIF
jgi:hypothetical protein